MKKVLMKVIKVVKFGTVYVGTMALAGLSVIAAYTANYTPADMPNIATDVIGEGGVQLKTYMPLLVLIFIITLGLGAWAKWRRAF